jgi:hypothetical protein
LNFALQYQLVSQTKTEESRDTMKYKQFVTLSFSVLVAVCLLLNATESQAATIGFHIIVNTSTLPGNPSAPFALDFQLNGGNPLSNTATISNFTFGGGAANSSPAATTFGLASGSLTSSVILNSNPGSFFNEFYQGFTPGAALGFDVLLTTNVNTPNPDVFSFAILDKNLFNIPTTGLGDSLVLVNLDSATPAVQKFGGTGPFSGVSVPEPASLSLLVVGLFALGIYARRLQY